MDFPFIVEDSPIILGNLYGFPFYTLSFPTISGEFTLFLWIFTHNTGKFPQK